MEEVPVNDLAHKIARLLQERGWNQEEFARITRLNRHTIRQILVEGGARRLRNATTRTCARALGLSVSELRDQPLDKLLPRMRDTHPASGDGHLKRLYDLASQPELVAWMERNPDRARQLSAEEVDELLAFQDSGTLTAFGVEGFVERLERRRRLIQRIHVVARTEYLELMEQLVSLLYEKVQPRQKQ
jgi:transcriptional regulator with XRE-family HTH domain